MSHEAARRMIAQAWKDVWVPGPLSTTVPIEYQNQKFSKPQSGPWGRYTLLPGETNPAALGVNGAKIDRTPFFLTIQVFIPEEGGTSVAFQVSDILANLNTQQRLSDDRKTVVSFYSAGLTPGAAEDGVDAFNVTIQGQWDSYQAAI